MTPHLNSSIIELTDLCRVAHSLKNCAKSFFWFWKYCSLCLWSLAHIYWVLLTVSNNVRKYFMFLRRTESPASLLFHVFPVILSPLPLSFFPVSLSPLFHAFPVSPSPLPLYSFMFFLSLLPSLVSFRVLLSLLSLVLGQLKRIICLYLQVRKDLMQLHWNISVLVWIFHVRHGFKPLAHLHLKDLSEFNVLYIMCICQTAWILLCVEHNADISKLNITKQDFLSHGNSFLVHSSQHEPSRHRPSLSPSASWWGWTQAPGRRTPPSHRWTSGPPSGWTSFCSLLRLVLHRSSLTSCHFECWVVCSRWFPKNLMLGLCLGGSI